MGSHDAIVIGGGHNGLTCAAYLARAGLRTIVLERSERLGGACVTEEPWPGFQISAAAHSLSLLDPGIVRDLGLEVEVIAKDVRGFAPFEDGGGLLLWSDPAKSSEAIGAVSPSDPEGYERFVALFEEAARRLSPLLTYPATRRHVRRAFRKSEIEDLYARTVTSSIASVARDHFESDVMQGLLGSLGVVGSMAGPETPGTAYICLHHFLGRAAGEAGTSGFVRGGMGAIAGALEKAVRSAGGEIRLEAPVARVKLAGRRVGGVVLDGGEEVDAPVVCSAADPKATVNLVSEERWLKEFVEDVRLLPTEGTVVKVNCALGGLPRFRGMESFDGPGPEHAATITIAPSLAYLEDACRAAAEGRPAEAMFCKAVIESVADEALAPEGKHTLSVFAQYAPYSLKEGSWDERREEIGDLVIGTLDRYAPGIGDLIEGREVLGPPDIESRYGMTGGHIFHGEMLPEWLFDGRPASGWHRHRTPVPGLYMCSAGTHPGGGVFGAPGRNAARTVVEDVVAGGAPSV